LNKALHFNFDLGGTYADSTGPRRGVAGVARSTSFIFEANSNLPAPQATRPGKHTKNIKKLWNITMLLMGKSTVSTGPFSIAILTLPEA